MVHWTLRSFPQLFQLLQLNHQSSVMKKGWEGIQGRGGRGRKGREGKGEEDKEKIRKKRGYSNNEDFRCNSFRRCCDTPSQTQHSHLGYSRDLHLQELFAPDPMRNLCCWCCCCCCYLSPFCQKSSKLRILPRHSVLIQDSHHSIFPQWASQ